MQREEQFNEVLKTDLEGSVINWLSQANTRQHFPRPTGHARLQSAAAIAIHPFTGMQLHVNLTGCPVHPQNALPCASISLSTPLYHSESLHLAHPLPPPTRHSLGLSSSSSRAMDMRRPASSVAAPREVFR